MNNVRHVAEPEHEVAHRNGLTAELDLALRALGPRSEPPRLVVNAVAGQEPLGGAHNDLNASSTELKKTILKNLKELGKLETGVRINERIEKFSSMGVFGE